VKKSSKRKHSMTGKENTMRHKRRTVALILTALLLNTTCFMNNRSVSADEPADDDAVQFSDNTVDAPLPENAPEDDPLYQIQDNEPDVDTAVENLSPMTNVYITTSGSLMWDRVTDAVYRVEIYDSSNTQLASNYLGDQTYFELRDFFTSRDYAAGTYKYRLTAITAKTGGTLLREAYEDTYNYTIQRLYGSLTINNPHPRPNQRLEALFTGSDFNTTNRADIQLLWQITTSTSGTPISTLKESTGTNPYYMPSADDAGKYIRVCARTEDKYTWLRSGWYWICKQREVSVVSGSADPESAWDGEVVRLTATDRRTEGWAFTNWTVLDGNLSYFEITNPLSETEAYFTMPNSTVTLEAKYKRINPFKDIHESNYYFEPVLWAYFHTPQITTGVSGNEFAPKDTCKRKEIITFLWRAAGCPNPTTTKNPFTDIRPSNYYYNAVLWAAEKGITTGTSPTTFSPNEECSRKQIVTFLWRFAGCPSGYKNKFLDVSNNAYFTEAVNWAAAKEITTGISSTEFAPHRTCKRCEAMTFLYRYMNQ